VSSHFQRRIYDFVRTGTCTGRRVSCLPLPSSPFLLSLIFSYPSPYSLHSFFPYAYIWLEFWGTHGERRKVVGAEWGRVWGGVSFRSPLRTCWVGFLSGVRGSGAEPRLETNFGVFWRWQNSHSCTYMTESGEQLALASPLQIPGDLSPCGLRPWPFLPLPSRFVPTFQPFSFLPCCKVAQATESERTL